MQILLNDIVILNIVLSYQSCQQRNCLEFALKAKPQRKYIPKNKKQHLVWKLVTSRAFEYFIFVLIMFNTIILAMKVRHHLHLSRLNNKLINYIYIALKVSKRSTKEIHINIHLLQLNYSKFDYNINKLEYRH